MKEAKTASDLMRVIESKNEYYAAFLTKICEIESKSDNKAGVDRVCDAVLEEGRKLGFSERLFPHPAAGNVASLTYDPGSKKRIICLSAHMDTVFPEGTFGYPAVKRDGDILRGPGVMDCKGGIAVALLVMDALRTIGYRKRPVRFILQSEEEIQCLMSSGATLDFLREEAKDSAAFFNLEGREKGKITTRRKGILRAEMTVHGKAAHAGDYFEGVSAIRAAARKIIRLEEKSIRDGITYNCGIIEGGTALNVIPDKCVVRIDIRVGTQSEANEALTFLRSVADHCDLPGSSAEVRIISSRKPMERTEQNVELFRHVDRVCRKYGFGPMTENFSNGGSDAAYSTLMGIPTIDDIGVIGDNYHSLNEWCSISSIAESAKIIALSILDFPESDERLSEEGKNETH